MKPSLAIWINTDTQEVKTDFMPQKLHPAEYGVALSVSIVHIARLFVQSNPTVTEEAVIEEIRRGIEEGIRQRGQASAPLTPH